MKFPTSRCDDEGGSENFWETYRASGSELFNRSRGPSNLLDFGIENPVVLTSPFPRYRHFKLTRIFVTVRVQCRGIAYSSSWIIHNYQELSFELKLLC